MSSLFRLPRAQLEIGSSVTERGVDSGVKPPVSLQRGMQAPGDEDGAEAGQGADTAGPEVRPSATEGCGKREGGLRVVSAWCRWADGDAFQQGASLKEELVWGGGKNDVEFDAWGTFRWRNPVASGRTGLGQREEVLELTRAVEEVRTK